MLDGSAITSVKVLGVTITSDLKWKDHINISIKKASQRLYIIASLNNLGLPPKTLWIIYNALIQSVLLYAFPSWCNVSNSLFSRLVKIEKKAQRIIGTPPPISLNKAAENSCKNLANAIKKTLNHPL